MLAACSQFGFLSKKQLFLVNMFSNCLSFKILPGRGMRGLEDEESKLREENWKINNSPMQADGGRFPVEKTCSFLPPTVEDPASQVWSLREAGF